MKDIKFRAIETIIFTNSGNGGCDGCCFHGEGEPDNSECCDLCRELNRVDTGVFERHIKLVKI